MRQSNLIALKLKLIFMNKLFSKGKGGKPSTTGNPSGKGRDNNPPKK